MRRNSSFAVGRKPLALRARVQSTISPTLLLPVLAAAALSLPRMQADAARLARLRTLQVFTRNGGGRGEGA